MDTLWDIIAQITFSLPPERLSMIIGRIAILQSVTEIEKTKKAWGVNFDTQLYSRFVDALRAHENITGKELAAAFQAAEATAQYSERHGRAELLWTGPQTSVSAMRHIEQALCELISSAERKIFITSFVVYKADNVIISLSNAMKRNVEINFLLEASQENGGTISLDSFRELKKFLPNANFYTWNAAKKTKEAAVHAKCALADESMALVSSANLTGKAMESNMELGTLIRGGALPRQLSMHLNALISEKVIVPLKSD